MAKTNNTNNTTTNAVATAVLTHFSEVTSKGNNDSGNAFMSMVKLGWNTVKLAPLAINATIRVADYTHGLVISTNTGSTLNDMNILDTLDSDALHQLGESVVEDVKVSYDTAKKVLSSSDKTKTKRTRRTKNTTK